MDFPNVDHILKQCNHALWNFFYWSGYRPFLCLLIRMTSNSVFVPNSGPFKKWTILVLCHCRFLLFQTLMCVQAQRARMWWRSSISLMSATVPELRWIRVIQETGGCMFYICDELNWWAAWRTGMTNARRFWMISCCSRSTTLASFTSTARSWATDCLWAEVYGAFFPKELQTKMDRQLRVGLVCGLLGIGWGCP